MFNKSCGSLWLLHWLYMSRFVNCVNFLFDDVLFVFILGLYSELNLCYCKLFVFRAVFSTLSLTVLSYCVFICIVNCLFWTNKDRWLDGWIVKLRSHDIYVNRRCRMSCRLHTHCASEQLLQSGES